MDSEWDESKRSSNLAKHGIDFVVAVKIFEHRFIEREDRRRNYGELRYRALGEIDGIVLQLAFTWRGGRRRIISARRASRDERRTYHESLAQGPGQSQR